MQWFGQKTPPGDGAGVARFSQRIRDLGLEGHIDELDEVGFTVIPPATLGLSGALEEHTACLGVYWLVPGREANGRPVWKHASADRWNLARCTYRVSTSMPNATAPVVQPMAMQTNQRWRLTQARSCGVCC